MFVKIDVVDAFAGRDVAVNAPFITPEEVLNVYIPTESVVLYSCTAPAIEAPLTSYCSVT